MSTKDKYSEEYEREQESMDKLMDLLDGEFIAPPVSPTKTPSTPAAALTYSQVEEVLALSHKAVVKLVKENKIPHVRFSEKRVRFPADAFWKWYHSSIQGPRA